VRSDPVQPNDIQPKSLRRGPAERSRIVARSGIKPRYQKTAETVK
jgi:hypothetical protein